MNNENNDDSRAKRILKMIQERQEDNLIPKQSARDLLNRFKEDATEEELKEMYCSPVYEEGFRAGENLAQSKLESKFLQEMKTLRTMLDLMIESRQ